MVRGCTGRDPDEARRQLLEERQNIAPPQLAADDHVTCDVDAVDLKNRLRDVETDCRNRLHVWLLRRGHLVGDHLDATYVPVEEPSTASKADTLVGFGAGPTQVALPIIPDLPCLELGQNDASALCLSRDDPQPPSESAR
jgi:hypothetical protein